MDKIDSDIQSILVEYDQLKRKLSQVGLDYSSQEYKQDVNRYSFCEKIYSKYQEHQKILRSIQESKELLSLTDNFQEQLLLEEDLHTLHKQSSTIFSAIKKILYTQDSNTDVDAIFLEIRACAGGAEASIFAKNLMDMYLKFIDKMQWVYHVIDLKYFETRGVKETLIKIENSAAYTQLSSESGVHRVQRVPTTESSGRLHTSTASVAIIPVIELSDINIAPKDLRIDTFRSSGAGGQHVNVTDSAVRITHIPTGIVVSSQGDRSQHKNKEVALSILKAKIADEEKRHKEESINKERKSIVGTGNRNEKIRTYNYPQNRITDHRINFTCYQLDKVMAGDLEILINSLRDASKRN